MSKRVVITGLGVISSIGIGWQEFWKNLLKGQSGISPVTSFDTTNHFTHNGGEVKNFKPDHFAFKNGLPFLNRASEMALASTTLALENSGLTNEHLTKYTIGVSFGTTFGAIQTIEIINNLLLGNQKINSRLCHQLLTHSTPSAVAMGNTCSGPNFMFSTACAAGNYAIGYGFDMIRLGRADIVLAGASDPFSRIAFTGFNQFSAVAPDKCQPFDKNRKGMMVAEGAGVLVLESLDNALRRRTPIYAEIVGYGLSCDAHHMTTASVEGITSCMRKAMQEAGISVDRVDYISAHGTGTVANDRMECIAIKEIFGARYKNIPVSSIKSMLGHTMGAASAIEAIVCALIVKNDIIPPTMNFETPDSECDIDCVPNQAREHPVNIALNNSYAFGGNNACLVLSKYINNGEE
jgi:3-oxoacyl-[acyl-carrier-protein] synthase II